MESVIKGENITNEKIMKSVLEEMLEIETEDFRIRSIDREELQEQNRKIESKKTKEEKERYKKEGMAIKQKEIIQKLAHKGYIPKQISNMLDLSEKKVKRIIEHSKVNKNI